MNKSMTGYTYYQARQYDLAERELRMTLELDRNFGNSYLILGMVLERKGLAGEAVDMVKKSLELMPGSIVPLGFLGYALATAGRPDDARQIIDQLKAHSREHYVSPYYFALICTGLGDVDGAIEWLERAYESRDEWLIWLGTEAKLDPLRSDPRFVNLMERVGVTGAAKATQLTNVPNALGAARPHLKNALTAATVVKPQALTAGGSAEHTASGAARDSVDAVGIPPSLAPASEYVPARAASGHRARLIGITALTVFVLAGLLVYKLASQGQTLIHFQNPAIVKLTTTGNIANATISPDGKYIVYAMDEAGKQGLWIRQVAVTNSVRLIPASEVQYRGLCFSHDGNYVYYVLNDRSNNRRCLYQVPALGGSPRIIKEEVDGPVSFSPDGRRMAFVRNSRQRGEDSLIVADEDGSAEREVTTRAFPDHLSLRTAPSWSPAGDRIAFTIESADPRGFYMKMADARVAQREEKLITPQRWIEIGQIEWLDDSSGLMMTAKEEGSSFSHLWFLSYPDGTPRRITSDLSDYAGVCMTSDLRVLATVQTQSLTNIWVAVRGSVNPEQITSGAGRYFDLSWTPDGKLLYASDVGGSADIFEMEANGTGQNQLTAGAGRNYAPVSSPDGRYVVFHSNRSGHWNIWRMDREGNNPVPLTSGDDESNWPDISPDGKWVVYEHVGSGTLKALWKVPIDGGPPVRLTSELCTRPCISPDGKWITSWQKDQAPNSSWHIAIFPFEGGQPVKRFEVPESQSNGDSTVHWSDDGQAILYIDFQNGRTKLMHQPLEGGLPQPFVSSTNDLIYSFDRSRDGRIAFSRAVESSDVVLIKENR
jgi:Tol biopolymer transport system component